MDGSQNTVLTGHIMRPGRNGTKRRPPQNVFMVACAKQVSEIGMPPRKLLKRKPVFDSFKLALKIPGKRFKVELLTRPDRRRIL